ncbi:Protein of unknown function [Gryllus bimaculatus]|nr:Protein of unknown function [Gryllus bimaculatus]
MKKSDRVAAVATSSDDGRDLEHKRESSISCSAIFSSCPTSRSYRNFYEKFEILAASDMVVIVPDMRLK